MFTRIRNAYRTLTGYQTKKEREALRGEASSGHLSPGQRQGLFRNRRKEIH